MTPKNFNIKTIAEKAGVSIATISRALNAETRDKVAPETLRKIEAILEKYPYTPDISARQMRKTTYKTIGVLFPHEAGVLMSDYYSQILAGAADALLETDYSLKMILIKPGKCNWDHYHFQQGEGVDGLVMTYWRSLFSGSDVFERLGIPCVVINNVEKNIRARFVAGDHYSGGRMAAEYLYQKGHRRIAFFGGKHQAPDARERLAGFRDFLKEKKIPLKPEAEFDVSFEEEKAYQMTDTLLAARPEFTAVFCMNDVQAFGVLRRLKDLKASCPRRLSVMGYDDDRRAVLTHPPLTSVKVPVYELAKAAVRDLLEQLQKKSPDFFKPVYFPVSIVERNSVAAVQ